MSRFTRRINKYKRSRSYKKGGTSSITPFEERKGIFDIASDKVGTVASNITNKVEDLGLSALGLEKKGEDIENNMSNALSGVKNTVNQTSVNAIDSVNNVLASDTVNNSVQEAAKTTAEISGKLAEKFNNAMNDPVIKEQLEEAIEHAGELTDVIIKSSEEPLKEAVKIGVEAGTDAFGAASAGIIKVGTDMMAAVPGVGAVIEIGKMLNDGSKAVSAVTEASSKAISTASDAFSITTENVRKGLRELEEKKKMAQQISNRTSRSINQFQNSQQNSAVQNGGRKTKRRFFRKGGVKSKSKSVRFTI